MGTVQLMEMVVTFEVMRRRSKNMAAKFKVRAVMHKMLKMRPNQ